MICRLYEHIVWSPAQRSLESARMASPRMASQSASGLCALTILLLGLTSATAPAQQDPTAYYNPASRTDVYGNARPRYRERRLAGLFQNQAQRQALRGYQTAGRWP